MSNIGMPDKVTQEPEFDPAEEPVPAPAEPAVEPEKEPVPA